MKSSAKIERICLAILVLCLPYHTFVYYLIGDRIPGFNFWKEAIIGVMFLIFLLDCFKNRKDKSKRYPMGILEWLMVSYVVIACIYIALSDVKFQALYMARIYIVPMLLVPVIKTMEIDKIYWRRLLSLVMMSGMIIAVWGLFQSLILGDTFLLKIGYPANSIWGDGKLGDEFYVSKMGRFQRLVGTFAAPNTCGLYFALLLLLILFMYRYLKINKYLTGISVALIGTALVMTFSRTSWVVACVGILIYCFTMVNWSRNRVYFIGKCLAGILIVLVAIDGTFFSFNITMVFVGLIVNTTNGTDTSMGGHVNSIMHSVWEVVNHPLGLGMGTNGPRALNFMDDANLTESGYFLMMYEVGIVGAVLYYAPHVYTLIHQLQAYKKDKSNLVAIMVCCMVSMLLVAFLALPYCQDFEILVYIFLIMAIGSVHELKNPESMESIDQEEEKTSN